MRRAVLSRLLGIAGIVLVLPCFLVLLATAARKATMHTDPLPTATAISHAFPALTTLRIEGVTTAWQAMGVTLERVVLSTGFSLLFGILFGVILGRVPLVWPMVQPTIDFFRSIPVTFFLPVAGLLAGSTNAHLPWVLAAVPCSLIMLLAVRQGVARMSRERIHAFQLLAGDQSAIKLFRYLLLPEMIPDVVAGLRLACSYSIVIVSVLEYMQIGSAEPGFGLLIDHVSQVTTSDPKLFAGILAFGFVGYGLNGALEGAERRLTAWREGDGAD